MTWRRLLLFAVFVAWAVWTGLDPAAALWLTPLVGVCCCGGEVGCCTGPFPNQYRFTLTGVTNLGCVTCSSYNREWLLTKQPGICEWWNTETDPCSADPQTWWLICNPGQGKWYLVAVNTDIIWELPIGSWNYFGSNVMSNAQPGLIYCNWPPTVTVSAV